MKKFTIKWLVENFSYCWHKLHDKLWSPIFFVEMMNSSWYLELNPRGDTDSKFISLFLHRCGDCEGPEIVKVNFQLSILMVDGTGRVLESTQKFVNEFEKDEECGEEYMLERPRINPEDKDSVGISDTLTVCCVMWIDSEINNEVCCYARTRIGLEKISFIISENIEGIDRHWKKTFEISASKDKIKLSGELYVVASNKSTGPEIVQTVEKEEIMLDILPVLENLHLMTCQIYLIDPAGKEVDCGEIDTGKAADRKHTFRFPMNLITYFMNHNLALRCECTLSTGVEIHRIEETFCDLHLSPFLREKLDDVYCLSYLQESKSVLDDLRSLYKDQILSDVQIKTATKTFPAHKSVLCARSSVFRSMLTTNMDEKITDCVQVDDLEDSTIEQLLLFLYTDKLEDLQAESAMKLYYAADKYKVGRLKDVCSSFLMRKLNTCNIVDLLIQADRQKDNRLKTEVINFICENKDKLFCTDQWEGFIETYPQLAAKTMHFYLKTRNGYY